jgi:hypothetical protein
LNSFGQFHQIFNFCHYRFPLGVFVNVSNSIGIRVSVGIRVGIRVSVGVGVNDVVGMIG